MRKISFFGIVMVLLLSVVGCSKQTELSTDVLPTKVTVMGYVRYITLNKNLQAEEPELVDKGHQVNIFYGVPNDKGNVDGYALKTVTVDDNGVIQSCVIDSIPASVNFDATGAITTDLSAGVKTKNELGENYGMVAWGGAIAEWNEQAAAFASYVTGKTAAEVAGIAVTESTKPADGSDLASSVTIAIGGFQALIAKAMQ